MSEFMKSLQSKCLFCGRKIKFSYTNLKDARKRCYCGSIAYLQIRSFGYRHQTNIDNESELRSEGKIREVVVEYDEHDSPLIYMKEFFPYTNEELAENFTSRQVQVILKRLKGEILEPADRKVLKKIRDSIAKARRLSKFNL